MNVSKRYIGKYVELQWMDVQFKKVEIHESPKGRPALATWLERGVIVDVSDGVVKIEHSVAAMAGQPVTDPDEHAYTAIPESLIESITVFVPERLDTLPQVLPG
jgi:hypothetical protein